MHSLINLKKRSLTAVAIAGCFVALTGSASANSVTLSINGGAASGSLSTVSGTSNSFTVTVFANLTAEGGGQNTVWADLTYDTSLLTATGCQEAGDAYLLGTSLVPGTGQVVGGFVYAPFTTPENPNCGAGSPGDGGLTTPGVVNVIAQSVITFLAAGATSGTLILGTVTFHLAGTGTSTIDADWGFGGFLGGDFIARTTGALGSVSVANLIPEPTTLALLGLGCLGLGLNGRRLRRR